jgi:hypothetical protein
MKELEKELNELSTVEEELSESIKELERLAAFDSEEFKALEVDPEEFKALEAENEKFLAEEAVKRERWVKTGFKMGGHLSAAERAKFDRRVIEILTKASSDPVGSSAEVDELTKLVMLNNRNLQTYQKDKRRKKSPKSKLTSKIPPMLVFVP